MRLARRSSSLIVSKLMKGFIVAFSCGKMSSWHFPAENVIALDIRVTFFSNCRSCLGSINPGTGFSALTVPQATPRRNASAKDFLSKAERNPASKASPQPTSLTARTRGGPPAAGSPALAAKGDQRRPGVPDIFSVGGDGARARPAREEQRERRGRKKYLTFF